MSVEVNQGNLYTAGRHGGRTASAGKVARIVYHTQEDGERHDTEHGTEIGH